MIRNVNVSFPFIMSAADYHAFGHADYLFSQLAKTPVKHKEFSIKDELTYIADVAWDGNHRAYYFAVFYTDDQSHKEIDSFVDAFLKS